MRRLLKLLLAIVMVLFVTGCNTSNSGIIGAEKYVTFSYSDSVTSDYKCKIKDSKINCIVIEPENNELVFMGWYDEYDNKVDIQGDFQDSVVLHPKFLNEEDTKKEKLSAPKYTITFNMNGGRGSLDKIEIEYEGQLPKLINSVPTREGYTFVGFFDKPDYTKGKRYYDEKGESIRNYDKVNNTTFYAGWEKKKETPQPSSSSSSSSVVIKPSSSSVKPSSSSSVRPSSSSKKSSASSIRPSSSVRSSSSSVRPSSSVRSSSSSSQTVISYAVTFNLNGGSGATPSGVNAVHGQAMPAITSTKPTRTGYTFTGWYDNNGTQYYTQDNKSARNYDKTSATTLYAGWKANTFTVAYNGNGNTGGSIANQTCTYDSDCILKSNVYTKTGYIFTGWKKNNSGNIVAASSSIKNVVTSGTVTYYAQWTAATYKVSFSLNGGTGTTPGAINATYGQAMIKISATVPTKAGYTFMGWYDNSNYTKGTQYYKTDGTSVKNYDKYSDTTLYAGWKVNTYIVSFNLNGGTGTTPGNVTVTYNSNMPKIAATTPTKTGYEFKGWYDNADWTIGKLYYNPDGSSARPYDKTSNTTLYAGWKGKGVTLRVASFNIGYFDGGSEHPAGYLPATDEYANHTKSKYMIKTIQDEKIDLLGLQEARDPYSGGCIYDGKYCYFNRVRCIYSVDYLTYIIRGLGIDTSNSSELNKHFVHSCPANVDATYSKYEVDQTKTATYKVSSGRTMDKVVINVNGVNISFYNTHLELNPYNEDSWAKMASIIIADENPVIVTGDYNYREIDRYNTYLKNEGFIIAAHDDIKHNMAKKPHYMDSIFVRPYGKDKVNHLSVVSSHTFDVYAKYSDHNMIMAELTVSK